MKTTQEERELHKESRRTIKMKRLIDRLGMKCANSERSAKIISDVLAKLEMNGWAGMIMDAIRRAN